VNLEEETEDEGVVNPPPKQHDDPIGEDAMAATPMANNQEHKSPDSGKIAAQASMDSLEEKIPNLEEMSGAKRQHSPKYSDTDKENPCILGDSSLVLFSSSPALGEWRKVEKKGRKI